MTQFPLNFSRHVLLGLTLRHIDEADATDCRGGFQFRVGAVEHVAQYIMSSIYTAQLPDSVFVHEPLKIGAMD